MYLLHAPFNVQFVTNRSKKRSLRHLSQARQIYYDSKIKSSSVNGSTFKAMT